MHVDIFSPKVSDVKTLDVGLPTEFNTIRLKDASGGVICIYAESDWADWDRLVRDVDSFRENQAFEEG